MNKLLSVLAIGVAFSLGVARAEDRVRTPQQTRMASCNQEAGGKTGDARKAFMKSCLSAKPATPQSRMKTCNTQAGDKKGDARKAFMRDCLKAKPA